MLKWNGPGRRQPSHATNHFAAFLLFPFIPWYEHAAPKLEDVSYCHAIAMNESMQAAMLHADVGNCDTTTVVWCDTSFCCHTLTDMSYASLYVYDT